ncbi:MAG: TetR/AcrR family transcriptional regulator [Pseudomonadota bacterium]
MSRFVTEGELETQTKNAKRAAYHHGDLRSQLLLAVRELIEEKGAENFSIAEAARKAGVSSAAPYRHFADKDEILKAVVLDAMDDMTHSMRDALNAYPEGSADRINALGQCYIDFARAHPGMFRLVFGITESHEGDEDLALRGAQTFGIVIGAVADYLGIARDNPEAKRRAYILWTVVHGHSWLTIDGKARQQGIDYPETDMLAAVSQRLLGGTVDGG